MKTIRAVIPILLVTFFQTAQGQTLTLQQCKDAAIENNLNLKISQEHITQSSSIKKAAFTQYLPSFGLTASYIRMNKPFQLMESDMAIPVLPADFYDPSTGTINSDLLYNPALMPLAFVINPVTGLPMADVNGNPVFQQYAWLPADQLTFGQKNNYLANFGLTQPVFTGGKIRQMNVMAEISVNIAEMQLSMEQEQLLIEVEELYWSMITLSEQLKLARAYRNLLTSLKIEVGSYWEEGIVMSNDYLKVQIKMDEVELNIMKLENGISVTRKALCQKMGIPLDQFFAPSDTIIPSDFYAVQTEEYIRSATTNRTELKLLEQSVLLSGAGVKMMRSRFLPDIGFTANYSYINPNPYAGFSETFGGDYNLGIMMNVPVFHFGERQHTMNAARSQYRVSQMELENARQLIAIQTEMAVNELNETWKAVEMHRKSYQLAEMNLKVMSDKWDEGMCKLSEFLEAQVLWQEAGSRYIDSKAEYRKKIMNIQKIAAIQK
jgi:outer membrane protein TolC